MVWDIVKDTNDIVIDYGTITRVDEQGEIDLIKVVKHDGYVYYIGTPDRQYWAIVPNVDDVPEDFVSKGYYYVGNEWLKRDIPIPTPTGTTENYVGS